MTIWQADPVASLSSSVWDSYPVIASARERSRGYLEGFRNALASVSVPERSFVGVIGSLGRMEATSDSDFDFGVYAVRGFDGDLDDLEALVVECEAAIAANALRLPNREGAFGKPLHLQTGSIDLIGRQGADGDSNDALTHRMLLLCESTHIVGERAWRTGLANIRGAYLDHHARDDRPPRFLLNDVVRYWRTMCVDFQGKMIQRGHAGWGTRNAKLRMSRKLLFVGGALPLFLTVGAPLNELDGQLTKWYDLVPLERLVAACNLLGASALVPGLLGAYNDFLELLDTKRSELDTLDKNNRGGDETWNRIKDIERRFQEGLEQLFFETGIAPDVKRYALF